MGFAPIPVEGAAVLRFEVFAPELWSTLEGILRLDGGAYVQAVALEPGALVAAAVVLAAGLSEAVGQCIVLFVNRVKPARFAFSLLVSALLFAFGYAVLVLSTWIVCRLPGAPHFPLRVLALVFALSYVPLLFSFLGALPYLGAGLMRLLRVWHLVVMVVGVAAVGNVDVFAAATYVWLGWLLMVLAQHSFGRPVSDLGTRLLDFVAGVRVVDDASMVIGRVEDAEKRPAALASASVRAKAVARPRLWAVAAGLGAVGLLAVIIGLALDPVRETIFGWQHHLPAVLQLPIDLLWLGIVAFVVTAFMAPLEALGWWAGWFGDAIDTSPETNPAPAGGDADAARFVVYLDGIAQSSGKYTPDIETFLDALAPELPPDVPLVRGVMGYSVLNKPLDDDPLFAPFWKFVEAVRLKNANSLLGMFINLRNVTIVAVSADPRYGPIYNFAIASTIYKSLIACGYPRGSGVPVTLIGYSGGGQMSCGAAPFLKRALGAPVDVISLGGVISGNDPILQLEHLYHLVGDRDGVERIGPVMFASRWPVAVLSYWNRAKRLGCLTEIGLGPVGHQVPGGMLDPQAKLPDGRTNLRQTLDYIESILLDRFVAKSDLPKKPTNYARYAANPNAVPLAARAPASATNYLPVAQWAGRLILPERGERFGGCWLEVLLAPPERDALVGTRVRLCWSAERSVRERVRTVVRDVNFSAEARSAAVYGGLVMPLRLDRWRLVDPLESLAGARPLDDVVVKLAGSVAVEEGGDAVVLRVDREPVQITGTYYGLLSFRGPAPGTPDGFRAVHYDARARAFCGDEEIVRLPPVVADLGGRSNSSSIGLDRSPLNAEGWYAYGGFDASGSFVVQSLAPRALLRPPAQSTLGDAAAAYGFARHGAWREIAANKGGAFSRSSAAWATGDRGLLVHTYGGIGGRLREKEASGPMYFGHFAYGTAEVVDDPLAGEPRFEIVYHQVYTQNPDGVIAGAQHWSRYMGDRQYGWAGIRPVCDAILRHDAFDHGFHIDSTTRASALDAFALQLEAMTARYRIGDGTGGTFVGPANNCSQDSNRALFATLRALRRFVEAHPGFRQWAQRLPADRARYAELVVLAGALRRQLQPLGVPRREWALNEYDLGSSMEDSPVANLLTALTSWRCILPRLAFDTIVGTFVRNGASLAVLGSSQIGGESPEIAPVVPFAL